MHAYHDLLRRLLHAPYRLDRTGVGTYSLFGEHLRFDLGEGLPLVTTKHVPFKTLMHELLWMIRGESNVRSLQAVGVHIWDPWAMPNGDLGPVYGAQWRRWHAPDGQVIDQLVDVITCLLINPTSRRLVVSAWNVGELEYMVLPPCPCLFQFYAQDGRLSCHVYQRSADVFLGLPFDLAEYAVLTHLVAHLTHLQPGDLVWSGGDVHLYTNHVEQAELQLSREPRAQPRLTIRQDLTRLDDVSIEDFTLIDYNPWPAIPAPIAV